MTESHKEHWWLKWTHSILFEKIYISKTIPYQWRMSKIILVHKKGPRNKIQNSSRLEMMVFKATFFSSKTKLDDCLSVFIFDKFANVHLRRILVLAKHLIVQTAEEWKITVFATKNMSRQYSTKNTTIWLLKDYRNKY